MNEPALAAWKLPVIVAAIAVSIVGGFYLGGPGLGMAVGALSAAAILVMAIRKPPLYPIVPPVAQDLRRHVLVVLAGPLEDAGAVEALLAVANPGEVEQAAPEILLLAPTPHSFLARWTSDRSPGLERAQHNLVLSAASLAKAGIAASARVGDEDLRQCTEDELRSFPATEVVLVTGPPGTPAARDAVVSDLLYRLQAPGHRIFSTEVGEVRNRACATPIPSWRSLRLHGRRGTAGSPGQPGASTGPRRSAPPPIYSQR